MTARVAAIFLAAFVLEHLDLSYGNGRLLEALLLFPADLLKGRVWELLTFQFLHGGLLHLACNLLSFWWLGQFAEGVMGGRRMLTALLLTGVVGGLAQGGLGILFPRFFGGPVLGASAGVSGLLAIFALLQGGSEISIFLGFLPVRAIAYAWAVGIVSLFCVLVPTAWPGPAHAAHLAGLLAGVAWVRLGWHEDYRPLPWVAWWQAIAARRRRAQRTIRRTTIGGAWEAGATSPPPVDGPDFIASQVDPILDKIAAHGIQSLTERERKILEAAGSRIGRS